MLQEYCVEIKPARKKRLCVVEDCISGARSKINKCVAHGGGNDVPIV